MLPQLANQIELLQIFLEHSCPAYKEDDTHFQLDRVYDVLHPQTQLVCILELYQYMFVHFELSSAHIFIFHEYHGFPQTHFQLMKINHGCQYASHILSALTLGICIKQTIIANNHHKYFFIQKRS